MLSQKTRGKKSKKKINDPLKMRTAKLDSASGFNYILAFGTVTLSAFILHTFVSFQV